MISNVDPTILLNANHVSHPWTSWSGVFAGVTTTIAVQIGLTELCIASGLALYQPTDPSSETAALAIGTVAVLLLCALLSVFLGGWVVGRMKLHNSMIEAAVHGMLVWAVAGIAAVLLTTISVGILAGGAFTLLGQGLSGAAKGLGEALPAAAQAVAPSWDAIKNDISSALTKSDTKDDSPLPESRFADRSRLMQLLAQSFSVDEKALPDADRDEVTTLVSAQLGISAEAARSAYDQWQRVWKESVSRFETAKEDAKQVAQETAGLAAKRLAQAAIVAFFAMVVGLCAAVAGALFGSACAMKCIESRTVACSANRDQ